VRAIGFVALLVTVTLGCTRVVSRSQASEPVMPDGQNQAASGKPLAQLAKELPLPSSVSDMAESLAWPSDEYVASHAPRDRSKEIPPVFPQGAMRDPKPIRPGAMTPAAARSEAEYWVRQVLRPECLPQDLSVRLKLVQEPDASSSVAICSLDVNGSQVRVVQRAWAMSVVVKLAQPPPAGTTPEQMGPAVFTKLFNMGERMAAVTAVRVEGAPAGASVFVPDRSVSSSMEFDTNWWGWGAWCTSDREVAVFFEKREDRPRPYMKGDPWF
jgi:hypothetical protein